jgi:ABC-type bacteriocin/lantibiotic exporter with double-glycine peptidase domain
MKIFFSSILNDIRKGENIEIYISILISIVVTILGLFGAISFSLLGACILLVLTLLLSSILSNRRNTDRLEESLKDNGQNIKVLLQTVSSPSGEVRVSDVIKTLNTSGPLEPFFDGSSDIFLAGVTMFTRSNLLQTTYKRLLEQGCNFRVVLVDPASPNLAQMAMGQNTNFDALHGEILVGINLFQALKDYAKEHNTRGKFEYVAFNYAPTLSIMRSRKAITGEIIIHVELPAYRSGIWERPIFRINQNDGALFNYFEKSCTCLWEDAISSRKAV